MNSTSTVNAITMSGGTVTLEKEVVQQLRANLRGDLLIPGDAKYDGTRQVWNGMVDKKPALIACCSGVADVINAVKFGRDHQLLVSVRGGGHNIAGKAVCNNGLMIDLSGMNSVLVDPVTRTANVEGGATLGDLDHETQAFGLATTVGVVTHTGVAGLTLGGGIGRIGRKYGLAIDNLLSVSLVTADGQFLKASETKNVDLFWGLRGGGGNFGIVTALEFKLHPVGPEVLGGVLIYSWEQAREVLKFYAEYSLMAPDELAMDAILMTSPEGSPVCAISVCYIGSFDEGEHLLQPLKRLGPPIADQVGPVKYTTLQAAGDTFFPIGYRYYWKTHFVQEIRDDAIDIILDSFASVPSTHSLVLFQQYGGAVSRVGTSETAYRHREAQYDFIPVSIWTDPGESEKQRNWVRNLWEEMVPFSTGGEYVNNLGDEGEDRIRAAYGDNYQRLVGLKNKYDPTNFFRLNANIKPKL